MPYRDNSIQILYELGGKCAGRDVKILNDSGNNNNFIRPKIVERLKLQQIPTPGFKVVIGSGGFYTAKTSANKCHW